MNLIIYNIYTYSFGIDMAEFIWQEKMQFSHTIIKAVREKNK